MKASAPQLDLREVSKRFGGVVANDRISLRAHHGEIVGLIGPNGSGKTTLFNSIVGHHPVDSGRVVFEGRDITGLRVAAVARLGVLRTFQQTRTYRAMTCLENLQISLPHPHLAPSQLARGWPAETTERALALLEFVGLAAHRHELAGALSFGQQRLLELVMALMNEPRLLLLDEPTAGINPSLINALLLRLRRVSSELGITMIVIEHNMRVIMALAERIYCLNRGQVLAEGPPERIREDPRVIAAYLGAR
jgi:ABC-type branched-subunit amino acid transport system ATPase component